MERYLEIVAARFGLPVEMLLLTGLGLGIVLLFLWHPSSAGAGCCAHSFPTGWRTRSRPQR